MKGISQIGWFTVWDGVSISERVWNLIWTRVYNGVHDRILSRLSIVLESRINR